ncbi:uncharacterized protein LOC144329412 isoform X3 [Macaca mulatta]
MAKPTQPETRGHGGAGARSQQQQSHQEPVHQEGVLRAEEVGRGRQRLSSHLGHQRQAVQLWCQLHEGRSLAHSVPSSVHKA